MHLVITDSGLGGLSVCAKLKNLLEEADSKKKYPKFNLKITYINAAPSNELGYNDMSEKSKQISTFKNIILNIEKFYSPDLIFIACGTLSVLLKELQLSKDLTEKIEDIIPIGTKLLLDSLNEDPKTKTIIFGTPTTISTNNFKNELLKYGISNNRIITQACPELATNISNDFEGVKVSRLIKKFVKNTLKNINNVETYLIVFLACTHYTYRELFFYNSFSLEGYKNINIISPNFASALFLRDFILLEKKDLNIKTSEISLEFISPYSIPKQEKETLTKLINPISTDTSLALQNAIIFPELVK